LAALAALGALAALARNAVNVIIVAFDGIVADTTALRAQALAVAAVEFGARADTGKVVRALVSALPGRSLTDVARAVVGATAAAQDPTLVELIALHAQRAISQRMRQGVDLAPLAHAWLEQHVLRGVRVVLRTDSIRADVDQSLRMFELLSLFSFVHCADDPIAATVRRSSGGSLKQRYASITGRLDGQDRTTDRVAYEASDYAAAIASPFVGHAERVDRSLFTP